MSCPNSILKIVLTFSSSVVFSVESTIVFNLASFVVQHRQLHIPYIIKLKESKSSEVRASPLFKIKKSPEKVSFYFVAVSLVLNRLIIS